MHSSVPRDVAGGYAFKSVCAGRSHSCGVTVEGIVLCWGKQVCFQVVWYILAAPVQTSV